MRFNHVFFDGYCCGVLAGWLGMWLRYRLRRATEAARGTPGEQSK